MKPPHFQHLETLTITKNQLLSMIAKERLKNLGKHPTWIASELVLPVADVIMLINKLKPHFMTKRDERNQKIVILFFSSG